MVSAEGSDGWVTVSELSLGVDSVAPASDVDEEDADDSVAGVSDVVDEEGEDSVDEEDVDDSVVGASDVDGSVGAGG